MKKYMGIAGLLLLVVLLSCLRQKPAEPPCNQVSLDASWDRPGSSFLNENKIKRDGKDYTVLKVTIKNITHDRIIMNSVSVLQNPGTGISVEIIKPGTLELGPQGKTTWEFKIYSNNEAPGRYPLNIKINEVSCIEPVEIEIIE